MVAGWILSTGGKELRMSEMSLSEYSAEIQTLIDAEAFDAAISMAQHLLRQYPKYIHGYRLLAQAALKKGEYREAADLFRRVLSADPEDLLARTGLAHIYREEGILDEAIWQMMRAFELAPGSGEVRQNLRRLFEQRDGRAPGRLKLNSAALARVYMRDGWYQRAIDELRTGLETEPDRVDLRVALAESLWRAGGRQEAVETAHEILTELPYCLKANLILGQFYAEESNIDPAWDRLQVAQALDPENEVAQQIFGGSSYLPPHRATIRPPGETRGAFETAEEEDLPQWLRSLSLDEETEEDTWGELVSSDWRDQLRATTEEALDQWQPDWRTELRRATERAIPDVAEARAAEVVDEPLGAAPAEEDWREALRDATEDALQEAQAAPTGEPIEESTPPAWVTLLRGETRPTEMLSSPDTPELEAAPAPPESTEEPARVDDEEETELVEARDLATAAGDEAEGLTAVELGGPEDVGPPVEPSDWRTALSEATRGELARVEEPATTSETAPTGVEGLEAVPTSPTGTEVEPATAELPETAEAVSEPATEAQAPVEEVGAEAEPVTAPPTAETTVRTIDDLLDLVDREPNNLEAQLHLADHFRSAGQERSALVLYETIFETGTLDEPLMDRLLAWVDGGHAGARVHQLLGDAYRRRGQLREAVAQYRAAINKM